MKVISLPRFDANTLLIIGAVFAGAYLIKKAGDIGGAALDSAAKTYVAITSGGAVQALGAAVLPTGQRIPFSQIVLKSDATFSYLGTKYRVTVRRGDGDYTAVKA